jgi:parallel beta-helix repeat protein
MKTALGFLLALVVLPSSVGAATITVRTTIQAAVDAAQPGDTIRVPPGIYRENVRVATSNLTIRGSHGAVLDGTGLPGGTGIRVSALSPTARLTGFTLSGLTIQNYARTGVLLLRVDDFAISDGRYRDNAEYAIFPIFASGGVIESNHVSGSEDSGIYVGQSSNVAIRRNHVTDCRVGFEIENSSLIDVHQNIGTDNSIGVFVFVLAGLDVTTTSDIRVTGNRLTRNNRPLAPYDPANPFAQIPTGVGLLNLGADRLVARLNTAMHNGSGGIIIAQVPPALASLDPRIDPFPDDNEIRDNVTLHNGGNPDPLLAPFPGADLLWDGSGVDNCWHRNVFKTAFPELPDCQR